MDSPHVVPARRPTVLIVEDHVDLREAIAVLFEYEDYVIAEAEDGAEALAYLQLGGPASAIVLDLIMPVMDGWEFLQAWRSDPTWRDIPILVLTGVPDNKLRRRELGEVAVLKKPFLFNELVAMMRRMMAVH
jgi:CheY-like chemotaxis protein